MMMQFNSVMIPEQCNVSKLSSEKERYDPNGGWDRVNWKQCERKCEAAKLNQKPGQMWCVKNSRMNILWHSICSYKFQIKKRRPHIFAHMNQANALWSNMHSHSDTIFLYFIEPNNKQLGVYLMSKKTNSNGIFCTHTQNRNGWIQ